MKTTLGRWGPLAVRALGMWAVFTVIYASIGYFLTDRGRPFLDLFKGAAVTGIVFLIFYGLLVGFLDRRKQRRPRPPQDPAR